MDNKEVDFKMYSFLKKETFHIYPFKKFKLLTISYISNILSFSLKLIPYIQIFTLYLLLVTYKFSVNILQIQLTSTNIYRWIFTLRVYLGLSMKIREIKFIMILFEF